MKEINNKFVNFDPNKKEKEVFDKLLSAFKKRSPDNSFLSSSVQQVQSRFSGVAKVYSGSNFFQVKAEGSNFPELVGKLRAKILFQLKRWRAKEKSHPKKHQHLSLAFSKNS